MKVKTSELSGAALDWAVAKCEYDELAALNIQYPKQAKFYPKYQPSLDWAQGGPIIERERIAMSPLKANYWQAGRDEFYRIGPSPLDAAMRCYVASKLGEFVDLPDELIGE